MGHWVFEGVCGRGLLLCTVKVLILSFSHGIRSGNVISWFAFWWVPGEKEQRGTHSTTRPNARERSFQARTIPAITNPLSVQRQRDALISHVWKHKR